jgi:hypothetical protein
VLSVASLFVLFACPTGASIASSTIVVEGEPPPREEAVPRRRPGYLWVPGYWSWNGERYVWKSGRNLRARHGFRHVPQTDHDLDGRYRAYFAATRPPGRR